MAVDVVNDEQTSPTKKLKAEDEVVKEPIKKLKVEIEAGDQKVSKPVDTSKVRAQIEYYFSDVNIVQDKFMLNEIKNNDGYIDISKLLTFARLKELTQKDDDVIEAFKDKESSLIEIDCVKKRIRRKTPIPDAEDYLKSTHSRSIHLRGFPTDYKFDQLKKFCDQYGEVESVNMRNHVKTRVFKGNINVVFKHEADVKKILEMEEFKCKDRVITREAFDVYLERKENFRQMIKEKRKSK